MNCFSGGFAMRYWFTMMLLGGFSALMISTHVESAADKKPKDKEPVKGPMFLPINPSIAKLDINITGLDGPGFGIAYGEEAGLLVVSCEKGTLKAFKKEQIAAFKAGPAKADVWKGHDGPVRGIAWTGGPTMASVGIDKKINFWKMPEGKITATAPLDYRIAAIAMSSDGKVVATAGESEVIQL